MRAPALALALALSARLLDILAFACAARGCARKIVSALPTVHGSGFFVIRGVSGTVRALRAFIDRKCRPLKTTTPASTTPASSFVVSVPNTWPGDLAASSQCFARSSICDRVQELGDALARHPEPPPSARLLAWVVLEEEAPDPRRSGWKFLRRQGLADFIQKPGLAPLPLAHQMEVRHDDVHALLQEAVGRIGRSRASVQQGMDAAEGPQQGILAAVCVPFVRPLAHAAG